jgi:hypothetical protein
MRQSGALSQSGNLYTHSHFFGLPGAQIDLQVAHSITDRSDGNPDQTEIFLRWLVDEPVDKDTSLVTYESLIDDLVSRCVI